MADGTGGVRVAEGLERFVAAQDSGGTYRRAVAELRAGDKTSHWMWFVFPQLGGLGRSTMAREYALASLQEARAFLDHSVLGPRLVDCMEILDAHIDKSALSIFGSIDAVKLRSCATLFARAAPDVGVFRQVLDRYFDGVDDPQTARLLGDT